MLSDKWQFWVVLNILVTAGWATFAKLARNQFNAATTSFLVVNCAWLTVFLITYGKLSFRWNIGWVWVLGAGIFGGLTNITFYKLIKIAPFASAMPLNELYLVLIPLIALFVFNESLQLKQIIGIGLGFVAMYLLLMKG